MLNDGVISVIVLLAALLAVSLIVIIRRAKRAGRPPKGGEDAPFGEGSRRTGTKPPGPPGVWQATPPGNPAGGRDRAQPLSPAWLNHPGAARPGAGGGITGTDRLAGRRGPAAHPVARHSADAPRKGPPSAVPPGRASLPSQDAAPAPKARGGPPWAPAPKPDGEPPSWAQPPGSR